VHKVGKKKKIIVMLTLVFSTARNATTASQRLGICCYNNGFAAVKSKLRCSLYKIGDIIRYPVDFTLPLLTGRNYHITIQNILL
jgi:hypothetical protein